MRSKKKMKREETHTNLESECNHLHGRLARREDEKSKRAPTPPRCLFFKSKLKQKEEMTPDIGKYQKIYSSTFQRD